MGIEVNSESAICFRCGRKFGRRKGNFPVNYSASYKGVGYLPICKECIDTMYDTYLAQCNDSCAAVRQMCRKLDLYWSESLYNTVALKSTPRSMMTQYIVKTNSTRFAGKCYDDTLSSEGTLWSFGNDNKDSLETDIKEETGDITPSKVNDDEDYEVSEEVMESWGLGYSASMYRDLEQRYQYWMSRLPDAADLDIGTEAIIRQICSLEIDIARDRMAGKPVDKSINAYNTLLGSASLKPAQKKDNQDSSLENTPFGVWIRRWETKRPIPEPDDELNDVDGIIRYISIWFFGHLCKMLGIKNSYCKLYEEEMAKRRVDKPEYEEEDDESLFNDIFSTDDSSDDYAKQE